MKRTDTEGGEAVGRRPSQSCGHYAPGAQAGHFGREGTPCRTKPVRNATKPAERLWKFLRKRALSRWRKTFEAMQATVSEVLHHLSDYRSELDTLMTEEFHIMAQKAIPVECREVA